MARLASQGAARAGADQATPYVWKGIQFGPKGLEKRHWSVDRRGLDALAAQDRLWTTVDDFTTAVPGLTALEGLLPAGENNALLRMPDNSGPLEVRYQVADDTLWDGGQEGFTLSVSWLNGALPTRELAATLDDNDAESTAFTLTLSPASIAEGAGGAQTVTATVALDEGGFDEDVGLIVQHKAGGTATLGTDITQTALSEAATIAAGATSATATFTVTPTDDTLAEGDETLIFEARSSTPSLSGEAVLTIVDDDNRQPTGKPTIGGTARVGETLTADAGDVADADGLGTFSYQWQADGTDIVGATGTRLALAEAQKGKEVHGDGVLHGRKRRHGERGERSGGPCRRPFPPH